MIVTGGSGFIGSAVMQRVEAENWDLLFGGRDIGSDADFMDVPIIHLAAITGIKDCQYDLVGAVRENIENTVLMASLASRIVFASSAAADTADTVYGVTKQAAENLIRLIQPNHIILRISNVYGPGSMHKGSVIARWCRDALAKGEIVIDGDGRQCRDFIYVDDVADNIVQALHAEGTGTYPLSTGILTPLNVVADMIAHWTGCKIRHAGANETREIRQTQGVKVKTGLEEGIQRTLEYFADVLAKKTAV